MTAGVEAVFKDPTPLCFLFCCGNTRLRLRYERVCDSTAESSIRCNLNFDLNMPGPTARSSTLEARRRARRVPEEQRKRGTQSCDLCRKVGGQECGRLLRYEQWADPNLKKRCRCIPVSSPNADGDGGQCTTCQAQGSLCSYTLPRKTRVYGNVEDLSDR